MRAFTTVYWVVLLSVLNSIGQRGSKVAVSLYALELGASAIAVGVLAALFSIFPLFLAVHAGRISDRFGVRVPMVAGGLTMAAGLVIPLLFPGSLAWLFVCPALLGLGHIYFHVSIHNLVGSLGTDVARTKNFSTFALGSSIAAAIGPAAAGFAIELGGYRSAFALLALVSMLSALYLVFNPRLAPRPGRHEESQPKNAFDLFAIPALRRTLIMSGVALTGIELFAFYLPIYGRSIGLSPAAIGLILSSYAVAGFLVRGVMHRLAQRFTEVGVLTASLFLAALSYFLMPGLDSGALLALAAFALGLALGSAQPLTIILTYNYAPAGRSGEALGMRIMANKVTQIAVPLAFGGFGAAMGAAPVFLATGAFLLVAGVISWKGESG
ncbi:MAG TPA: MFS transporter [Burkholderiales bacterium]|nr:MFS transporter [Burkholderiales bacterium]